VSDKLQGVVLSDVDFEEVIDTLPDGCFVFVDPPYYAADQDKFYNAVFEHDDHKRLAECLKRNSNRLLFLLTYDDHPDIRRMYKWVSSIEGQGWNYTINRTDDQRNGLKKRDGFRGGREKGSELFVRNYDIQPLP
jgi:DNA adenine methylase